MFNKEILKIILTGLFSLAYFQPFPLLACAPGGPITIKLGGTDEVLAVPVTSFEQDIMRIRTLVSPEFKSDIFISEYDEWAVRQTTEAEEKDLRAALEKMNIDKEKLEELMALQKEVREALDNHKKALFRWKDWHRPDDPEPELQPVEVPDRLPPEFRHYLSGAVAYFRKDMEKARMEWQEVLDLPREKRHYRSTWSAYMIGRTWLGNNPEKAVEWFRKVRDLAKQGFSDSLSLAVSSYGGEARAELDRGGYNEAMRLYLTEYAAGDPKAKRSLQMAVREIFDAGPEALKQSASDPMSSYVINTCIVSHCCCGPNWSIKSEEMNLWLDAAESAAAQNMEGADRMAWAAYRNGQFDIAMRWVERAPADSLLAQWLRGKLLTREGRIDDAVDVLSRACKKSVVEGHWSDYTDEYAEERMFFLQSEEYQGVEVRGGSICPDGICYENRICGELAVLKFSQGKNTEALDSMMRAGYEIEWRYLAEKVLSINELRAYVDKGSAQKNYAEFSPYSLKHILAWRLTRSGYWKDARKYYPENLRPVLDSYINAIRSGYDKKLSEKERAESFWKAYKIGVQCGYDLLGSGSEEIKEAPQKEHEEDMRHYRYIAADHAWSAVQLMPDQSDETAKKLCQAGSSLKYINPEEADRFYKALVNRCGSTELGKAADEKHWFPECEHDEPEDYECIDPDNF